MTTPIDKVFMRSFSYYAEAFLPLLAILLAALGFMFGASVVVSVISVASLFALGAFVFAVTALVWALAVSLIYTALLVAALPFHSLYAVFRKTHKAS